jgi:methyl-accepting chemotaxis protein
LYFERRLKIGKLHNMINLPLKWYIGSYAMYQDLVRKYLAKSFPLRPIFRARAERAIFTVFTYDIQAVSDAFFYDYLQSVGLGLDNIQVQSADYDLSDYYDWLKSTVRDPLIRTAQASQHLAEASVQLTIAADQASKATQQITETIQQIAQGATQQARAFSGITTNAEQIARASDGIARGAQEQAEAVQKTSRLIGEMTELVGQMGLVAETVSGASAKVTQAARSGTTAVGQTAQGMERIQARTIEAAAKIKEMGERSDEIGQIVETIDDIADKTDMLALNAAVEAARAGEHGRGFTVVAEQVRKLSEDAKAATRNINLLIKRVQESVREAVSAIEATTSEVANGTRLAGDTSRSLDDILRAADEAAALAERITGAVAEVKRKTEGVAAAMESVSAVVEETTAAAEQMAAGSREVTDTMEGVASVAEENSAAAEEVSAAAEEMSAQVSEVVTSAQELSALAEELRQSVSQFRVDQVAIPAAERPQRAKNPGAPQPPLRVTARPATFTNGNGAHHPKNR